MLSHGLSIARGFVPGERQFAVCERQFAVCERQFVVCERQFVVVGRIYCRVYYKLALAVVSSLVRIASVVSRSVLALEMSARKTPAKDPAPGVSPALATGPISYIVRPAPE